MQDQRNRDQRLRYRQQSHSGLFDLPGFIGRRRRFRLGTFFHIGNLLDGRRAVGGRGRKPRPAAAAFDRPAQRGFGDAGFPLARQADDDGHGGADLGAGDRGQFTGTGGRGRKHSGWFNPDRGLEPPAEAGNDDDARQHDEKLHHQKTDQGDHHDARPADPENGENEPCECQEVWPDGARNRVRQAMRAARRSWTSKNTARQNRARTVRRVISKSQKATPWVSQ